MPRRREVPPVAPTNGGPHITRFHEGDEVIARRDTSAQLVRGVRYTVLAVDSRDLGILGVFVTYTICPVDRPAELLLVQNGHLVMELAPPLPVSGD